MSNQISAIVNLGKYSTLDDDFFNSVIVDGNGNQNLFKTIDNHIALLKDAIISLELIKDSTDKSESKEVELFVTQNVMRIIGNQEIINRYIECGIAIPDDNDDNDDSDDGSSESSVEYNEYDVESDSEDTPIKLSESSNSSNDTENEDADADSSELSDEVPIKKNKNT